jgi:LPXTG-motif cell wall-anchored protein
MAYARNNLVSRSGYSGVGGVWDTITDAAGGVLKAYNSQQQAAGAAKANQDLTAALLARQGISTSTLLIGGLAIGAVALLVMRKKKD